MQQRVLTPETLSVEEYGELLRDPEGLEAPVTDATSPLTIVRLASGDDLAPLRRPRPPSARVVVAWCDGQPPSVLAGCDALVTDGDEQDGWVSVPDPDAALARMVDTCARSPLAASTVVQLLRLTLELEIGDAVLAESFAYSMLLAGPEFRSWLEHRRPVTHQPDARAVRVEMNGDTVAVVLDRPDVRNAYSAAMRDDLVAILRGLAALPHPPMVVLRGAGPSFSAGGDLSEFGTTPDPATAHAVRAARSPGLLLHALGDRVTALVHGPCIGAGVELPAFCGRVLADPGTTFRLPEVKMGLLPGAGGTASLPRRIGRHRTAFLALTGESIDADRAQRWHLVDALEPVDPR